MCIQELWLSHEHYIKHEVFTPIVDNLVGHLVILLIAKLIKKSKFKPRSGGITRYSRQMVWRDQDPPAIDVLLDVTVPFSGGGTPAYLEIDKLPDGQYRATVGTLFEFQELCRTSDLEGLLRHVCLVQVSRSFNDMVSAIRAMYVLDDSGKKS